MKRFNTITMGLLAAFGFFIATAMTPSSAMAEVNFAGKTVEMWVPFKTGGGTDRFVRLFQPFLKKYLPGNPDVVVFNKPGGASLTAANLFNSTAPKDGTAVLGVSTSTLVGSVLNEKRAKFDPVKWRAIIVSPRGGVLYANKKMTGVGGTDTVANIKSLQKQELLFGMKNPASAELRGYLAYHLLGIKVKPVFGLSTGKRRKAVIRNELHVGYDPMGSYVKSVTKYVKKGQISPLFSFGFGPELDRDPAKPKLPSLKEAYKMLNGKNPSGIEWKAMQLMLRLGGAAAKSLVLPPNTPDDVRDVYLTAIKKTVNDPEFKAKAKLEIKHYPLYFGDQAEKTLKTATTVDPAVKAWLKKFIKSEFNVDI